MPFGPNSKVFFVDTTNGSDGNDGLTPEHAKATITNAIAQCITTRRDVIYVLDWSTDNGETWPLAMSKAGVTLVGMPTGTISGGTDSMARIICPDAAAAIALTAHQCRIVNCYIYTNASYDAITFAVNGWTGIIGNTFGRCTDACGGGASASTSIGWCSEISYNLFTSQVADHGIYQNNPATLLIKGNHFQAVQGTYALEIVASSAARIVDNRFGLNSNTAGSAIRMGHATTHCYIDGNHANFGMTAMSNNPFQEQGHAVPGNDWGVNYQGVTATMPVEY